MINFEEELKRFKPSLEIDDTEKAIMEDNAKDMTDLMVEMIEEYRSNH